MPYSSREKRNAMQKLKRQTDDNKRESDKNSCAMYYQRNKTQIQIQRRNYQRDLSSIGKTKIAILLDEIYAALGDRCATCGFSNRLALQIDHVNGYGTQHRKSFGTNLMKYYRHILDNADSREYQVLCANCHAIKTKEDRSKRNV